MPSTPLPAPSRLLALPAPHAARLLCRHALTRVADAAGRLGSDPTAALAMASALRALRVVLSAYARPLESMQPELAARRAAALGRLVSSVSARAEGVLDQAAAQHVMARWRQMATPFDAALTRWRERHAIDAAPRAALMALVAADAVTHATERAARRAGTSPDAARAESAAHALHTLLTPLAAGTADGDALLAALVADGPALATWHDASVRAERVGALHALADAWRQSASPPVEIERKWLLSAVPPRAQAAPVMELAQGYLPGEALVERVRRITSEGSERWVRTVKLGRGMSRIEVEEDTTPDIGAALFALTRGRRVTKRRFTVAEGAHHWEIDEFTDRELVLAELELQQESDAVTLPGWLAPYVVREVTGEKDFTNWQLAR